MFVYIWSEKDKPNECKFGERWVRAGTDARNSVEKRIKESLGVRKDLLKDGTVQINAIMDVSTLAKRVGRFYKQSRMDDYIRGFVGFRKGKTGEVHLLSPTEMEIKVSGVLSKYNQPLAEVGLTQNQYDAAANVLKAIGEGKRTILAELCPRFGKTIWSLALAKTYGSQLVIVTSYVLSSFSSFKKELAVFEQFKDFVVIDSAEDGYKKPLKEALSGGKKVVVFLSMCNGELRQDRIDHLFGIKTKRMVIIDEADYGIHKAGQCDPLSDGRKPDDVVILMTGTSGDRATGGWETDHYLSVTYPELLLEKKAVDPTTQHQTSEALSKHFSVDPSRHSLTVDVDFYQMDLMGITDYARKADPELFVEDGVYLPAWSKFSAQPNRAKGFFINVLQAIFEGKGGFDNLNVDFQTNRSYKEGNRVAMMFLPGSTTKENLLIVKSIAMQTLPGWSVVLISGADGVKNDTAEKLANEAIEKAEKAHQNVLLLSAGMAQRSFSVKKITELYLAYDEGELSTTIQKISRALTPDTADKIGRIFSLSFDPTRDDKFDSLILETAKNYNANKGIGNLHTALGTVLTTVDIFRCLPDGAVKVVADDYLAEAMARNSIDRVIGKDAQLHLLSDAEINALAQGDFESFSSESKNFAQHGKTRLPKKMAKGKNGLTTNSLEKNKARVRELIAAIANNFDIIRYFCGSNDISIDDLFEIMDKQNQEVLDDIEVQFGVQYSVIKDLICRGVINRDLLDLKFSNKEHNALSH